MKNNIQIGGEQNSNSLEDYFQPFREQIIGQGINFPTPNGSMPLIYTDWTASGRLYKSMEDTICNEIAPFIGNTHTENSITGSLMTLAYRESQKIIKNHVNASSQDILINTGTGMTGAVNKFQRILGLKLNEQLKKYVQIPKHKKTIVFITHMEHHSNHTSWLETIAKVEVIAPNSEGLPCLNSLKKLLKQYEGYARKIAAVTACSNVTGIKTEYYKIAEIMHEYGGFCFVDFACSAPYVEINMHPNKNERLDAIAFSPHKFLGGPGSSGVLIFNKSLYQNAIPDNPGGGTVNYTNPWGEHNYLKDIEMREDGGTPGFIQTVRSAFAIKIKENMGVGMIAKREIEINQMVFGRLTKINNLVLLASNNKDRLSIFSFYIKGVHYNLVVKLLNDRYGIQARGGCSCAGTYGHHLLGVNRETSYKIRAKILNGNLMERPGWIRISFHPTMTNSEIITVCDAVKDISINFHDWESDYVYQGFKNEFIHKNFNSCEFELVHNWLSV